MTIKTTPEIQTVWLCRGGKYREISVSRTPLFEIKNSFKFEHERNFIIKHKKEVIPSEWIPRIFHIV